MSQMIFTMNRPERADDIIWRRDGEEDQIIILSKDGFPLPIILNPTAVRIFLLCDGKSSLEDIARSLCEEFSLDDSASVLSDVKEQVDDFIKRGIIKN